MSEVIISKRCSKCKQLKPISEFYKRSRSKDGFQSRCKSCKNLIDRNYQKTTKGKTTKKRYRQSEKGKTYNKRYQKQYAQSENGKEAIHKASRKHRKTTKGKASHQAAINRYNIRHPKRHKARMVVNNAIKVGKLPKPNSLQCHYCPEQAEDYHHHKGYAPEHWLDVVPVCKKCHTKIHSKMAI